MGKEECMQSYLNEMKGVSDFILKYQCFFYMSKVIIVNFL
jgi:hypothetical protein